LAREMPRYAARGMGKKEAASQAVRDALDSWNFLPPPSSKSGGRRQARAFGQSGVRTELSTTVFSAEPDQWVSYLTRPPLARYEPEIRVRVHCDAGLCVIAFDAENEASQWLASFLEQGMYAVRRRLQAKPNVLSAFEQLATGETRQPARTLSVVLSPYVPSDGTRESAYEDAQHQAEARVVLHSRLVRYLKGRLESGAFGPEERLGFYWPAIARLVSELAYPRAPLDRFAAKVDVFAKLTYVAMNVLYDESKGGRLRHSAAGHVYEDLTSASTGIPRHELENRHPYFRMLGTLGFLLRGERYSSYASEVEIAVREYLDELYLRLSLSGAMPDIPEGMRPMSFQRDGRKVRTSKPVIGQFGVQNADDLAAWKAVDGPFHDIGFTLLAQLGLGEFGRVYEVLNDNNPRYPERLALKVDRIQGKKKKAILEAEQAMLIGRELASAHHLIRLYDTGKLRGERYTYHVLQLVDGDTLDNLVGVTGTEHASVSRPPRARASEFEGREEYERAIQRSASELWRRQRLSLPFAHPLSAAMILDLLSSVLLCLEEVHRLRYAINDLKNGNLMMSRRGQLKGIDLDSYAPLHSSKDTVTDFMFLAVSVVLLVFSARGRLYTPRIPWEQLIQDEAQLRAGIRRAWPFGDIETLSEGRVSEAELADALVRLVLRSRQLEYAKRPDLFSEDVARLIGIKRRVLPEEMVID
ncbi:MAG TPA: hypothetical protein VGK73_02655, partial [Polyangiaceae bacterium]